MAERRIKRLPVLNGNGQLVGVVSRVDILNQMVSEEAIKRAAQAPAGAAQIVGDIMLSEVPAIHEDAKLEELVARFLEAGTRRLIVTDDAGRPLGLISDADVIARVQPAAQRGVLQALLGKRRRS